MQGKIKSNLFQPLPLLEMGTGFLGAKGGKSQKIYGFLL
jgi:hypothetical protein